MEQIFSDEQLNLLNTKLRPDEIEHKQGMSYNPAIIERFWAKVKVLGVNDCWEWQASLFPDGYGVFGPYPNQAKRAHRISYEIVKGAIGPGLVVCHSCDNRKCVNPNHLWLGTHQDNTQDRVNKGRSAFGDLNGSRKHPEKLKRGEESPKHKVSDKDIRTMRELYATGDYTQRKLAEMFNCSNQLVSYLVNNRLRKSA